MLDTLRDKIEAREHTERAASDNIMPDIQRLAGIAREKGHCGFILIEQCPGSFVGAFLGRDGKPTGHTWANHQTPEAALVALGG